MDAVSVKTSAEVPPAATSPHAYDADSARLHAEKLVTQSKTSFGAGMKVLPPQRRAAMYAIYAFCREVDDIADEPGEVDAKRAALAEWRTEIARLYVGNPKTLTAQALLKPVEDFDLPQSEFLAVIEGMEMDVDQMIRAPSMSELERYCRCVAGAVGLLSVRAFGANGPSSEAYALALGEAFQLTNILRDIATDAEMGRVYLPRELLLKYGIQETSPEAVTAHPALDRVCEELAQLAEQRYAKAQALAPDAGSVKSLKPATVMMAVYWRVLGKLKKRGFVRWREPVGLNFFEKLYIGIRYGLL